jgi:single-stranded-DNA-specific exonuclease
MTSPTRPLRRWQVLPRITREQAAALNAHPLIAQLLHNRGIRTAAEAERFFKANETADPFRLPDAGKAVERLVRAVKAGERIAVYGDFDADGVTASAVLTEGLRGLGASPAVYIPDRVQEGHGLNLPAIQHLHRQGASLIITADCGVSSPGEVAAAAELGMEVVITDHHTPPDRLPEAAAVVNPKLALGDPAYVDLASVGVSARLMDALYAEVGRPADESLLEYVALGTVADLAPMHGAINRSLVREGMRRLNSSRRAGILELMKVARIQPGQVDTEAVSYALGPRLNAPGRMNHANPSYFLLVARTPEIAAPLAAMLDAQNLQRQQATRDILAKVQESLREPLPPIFILGSPEFKAGIVGLAAGKLTEQYNRPAVVCEVQADETRGSCRSTASFNIVQALRKCEDLFTRYGGHAQAAGFVMPTRNFPALQDRLTEIAAASLAKQDLTPSLVIDAEWPLERVNGDVIRGLQDFAPYGPQNPSPVLLSRRVEVRETRAMGAEGQHTRLKLRAGPITWDATAFDTPPPPAPLVDLVYTLRIDRWGGQPSLQIRVLDMAPVGAAPRLL